MGKQDTARKLEDATLQIQRVQYPNVWLRSVEADHGGVRGPEWRQLEHGKCHHEQDSQGRSKQRQNF